MDSKQTAPVSGIRPRWPGYTLSLVNLGLVSVASVTEARAAAERRLLDSLRQCACGSGKLIAECCGYGPGKCPRCGAAEKDGICQNYGCEGTYKTS